MKNKDYNRQLVIANSLYEMGLNIDVIKAITTVSKNDLIKYRKDIDKNDNKEYN